MQIWEPPQVGKWAVSVPERLLVCGKGSSPAEPQPCRSPPGCPRPVKCLRLMGNYGIFPEGPPASGVFASLYFPVVFCRSFNPAKKGDSAFCSGHPTSQHQNPSPWVGKVFMVPSVLTPGLYLTRPMSVGFVFCVLFRGEGRRIFAH